MDYFLLLINISIVFCSILELYLSLFSVIKWIIVVMKYGLKKQIKTKVTNETKNLSRSQYNYHLQLITINKKIKQVSNLNIIMEEDINLDLCMKVI